MTIIFENGFEDLPFTGVPKIPPWTAIAGTPVVQAVIVNQGTYAVLSNADADATKKDFTPENDCNARIYVRWSANPASNTNFFLFLLSFSAGGTATRVAVQVVNDAGTIKWQLWSVDNTTTVRTKLFATPNPTVDTWYCVELGWLRNTLNGASLWVNDVLVGTNDETTYDSSVQNLWLGTVAGITGNVYHDCVVVADAYIGLEGGVPIAVFMHHYNRINKIIRG